MGETLLPKNRWAADSVSNAEAGKHLSIVLPRNLELGITSHTCQSTAESEFGPLGRDVVGKEVRWIYKARQNESLITKRSIKFVLCLFMSITLFS